MKYILTLFSGTKQEETIKEIMRLFSQREQGAPIVLTFFRIVSHEVSLDSTRKTPLALSQMDLFGLRGCLSKQPG